MASRFPLDQNLLADLVERRIEAPDVEYKNFMPLAETIKRAKIARHICALANSGGGWLIFGFEDDGAPSEPHPADLADRRFEVKGKHAAEMNKWRKLGRR